MTDGSKLVVDQTRPHGHLVQLYEADDTALVDSVAGYFVEGLKRRQGAVIVATPHQREAFIDALTRLGTDVDESLACQELLIFDAHVLLETFMIDGSPDEGRFDESVGAIIRQAHVRARGQGLRVYGEMVGELWKRRQFEAAIRLEHLWNKLAESVEFHLYCSYPIDLFDEHLSIGALDEMLCTHSHLLPAGSGDRLETAVARAMAYVLGADAKAVKPLVVDHHRHVWAAMPRGEATIFWLRENLPDKQAEILSLARRYYRSAL